MLDAERNKTTLNSLVEEYVNLKRFQKQTDERLNEIKASFKARGTFVTSDYVVAVKEIKRECVGPNDRIIQLIGRKKLEELQLIYETNYLIVSATPKGKPTQTV